MNRLTRSIPVALLSASLMACGSSGTPQERVDDAISKLVKTCNNSDGDSSGAEGLVAYSGSDKARKYKSLASAEGDDRRYLNKACWEINALFPGKERRYTLSAYQTEEEPEGVWHVRKIAATDGKTAMMAFLEIDGAMALGDID
jgi:hypothetical protein